MAASKPKMAYFGPKDPITGERPEEMPAYTHISLPVILYHPDWTGWPLVGRMYNNMEEVAEALGNGWMRSPAEKGVITEPSPMQREAAELAAFTERTTGVKAPLPPGVVIAPPVDEISLAAMQKAHEKTLAAERDAAAEALRKQREELEAEFADRLARERAQMAATAQADSGGKIDTGAKK